ncbi:unnamed protein product [Macrosiphum euphorbiae]|uniref:Uncharacterized protein n=1 Tax=Macrosiphum euphorbiae TaxID=13131 RepID=A0AAV0VSN2_9HEMI|nr:unnamed protein product [Macrosiphum euphorbiae]
MISFPTQYYDQDNYCIIRQATDRVVGVTLISSDLRAWRAALTSDPVVRHGATAEDEHASSLRSDTAHVGTSFRRTIINPIVVRVFVMR